MNWGIAFRRTACSMFGVLLLLAALSGTAAAAVPALPETTTISGATTGYVDVELTKTLRPLDEDAPVATRQGGGLFTAAVLRPAKASAGLGGSNFEILWIPGFGEIRSYRGNSDRTLPAGDYRLYLAVADPGSVTLEFENLPSGTLSTSPVVHTPFEAGPLETRGTGEAVRFGQTRTVSGGGRVFVRAVAQNPPLGAQIEMCSYQGDAEAQAGDSAYSPGCPGGNSGYKAFLTGPGQGAFSLENAGWSTKQIGSGGNVSVPFGSPGKVDAYGVWMSYDFPPPPQEKPKEREREPFENPPPIDTGPTNCANPKCPSSDPPPPQPESRGAATLGSKRLRLRRGQVRVPLACSGDGPCRGTVSLARSTKRFAFPAGTRSRVRLRSPRRIARRVRRQGRARVRLVITSELSNETREQRTQARVVHARSARRASKRR